MKVKHLKGYDFDLPFRLDANDIIDIAERENLEELEVKEAILIAIYRELAKIKMQLEDIK